MQYPTIIDPDHPANNPLTMQTVGYQYDVNGRMNEMTWAGNSYATATYGPAGQMLSLAYGGLTESRTYNSMMQLTNQTVTGYMDNWIHPSLSMVWSGWYRRLPVLEAGIK